MGFRIERGSVGLRMVGLHGFGSCILELVDKNQNQVVVLPPFFFFWGGGEILDLERTD